MPEPRRVGLLGAGYIASYHARALRKRADATLVAVCDRALDRARALADELGVPHVHGDLESMLAAERLDALHVLLPPPLHAPAVDRALDAGVHVLAEKPLATAVDDAERLAAAAKRAGVVLATSHNFLFTPAYERFRGWVRDGRLGPLDELEMTWQKPLDLLHHGPFDAWMLRDAGNIALEIAPHAFAHAADLCPEADAWTVRADDPVILPDGRPFFRRFEMDAAAGRARVRLRFGFGDGYAAHGIRARGSVASAEVDFERHRATWIRHRPYGLDLDRLAASVAEGLGEVGQGLRTFAGVALGKAGVGRAAAPFEAGIERSVDAFHAACAGAPVDARQGADLAIAVVRTGCRAADALRGQAPPARPAPAARPAPDAPDTLVLGGTGFIGRALVRRLVEAGAGVRLLARRPDAVPPELAGLGIEIVAGDLRDEASLDAALEGVARVHHLARGYGDTWAEALASDVEPTRRLAERCLARGVERLVYASSIVIYDTGDPARAIDESTPPSAALLRSNVYARSKAECERLLLELHRTRGLPVVIARPGIVVGVGASPMHYGVGNWPFPGVCDVWGAGRTPLPLVLVEDVADGLARCGEAAGVEGESFNLVGAPLVTAREYLDALERASGVRIARRYVPPVRTFGVDLFKWAAKSPLGLPARGRPELAAARARTSASPFDGRRARERLGWAPVDDRRTLIAEGIERPTREWSA